MRTIKSSSDISRLFSHGVRVHSRFVTFIVLSQHDRLDKTSGRVAFIAGKKQGNAVWRNAAKRRLREALLLADVSFCGLDVVMMAKKSILQQSFSDVSKDIKAKCEIIETNEFN